MARKAKKMAAKLIKIHTEQHEHFILPQNALKTISGRKKMTPKFLSTVDELLRKQGYALIDLHTEKGLIGIVSIDGLNRPTGGLLVIDVSEYQPFRTTGRTVIEIFLNRRPEGNVIAFLRDPIVAHLTHTYPA